MEQPGEWIEAARGGSREAFSRIVLAYQSRVRAYLWGYVRDKDVVEDLAQETFLHAYRGLPGYRGDSTVGVWLIGISRNLAAMYLREKTARRARENEVAESTLTRWLAAALERESTDSGHREREITMLENCIGRLPGHSAQLIRGFYFKGEPAADLGRRMGKREGTVWVTLLRIRQALRRCIETHLGAQGA